MDNILDRRALLAGGAIAVAGLSASDARSAPSAAEVQPPYGFGWVKDRPDVRDKSLQAQAPSFTKPAPRPAAKDLSSKFPEPYDQGQLGSCTANAIAGAVQYARRIHNKPNDFVPSRTFIYYMERKMERTVYFDGGAQIRDGISVVATYGVPSEDDWKYDGIAGDPTTHVFPANAQAVKEPTADILKKAAPYKSIAYVPLTQDIDVLESCIAAGYPFVFGFVVYDNFDGSTKLLKKPGPGDKLTPYGHAVLATGYDQKKRTFRIRNSWGKSRNDGGYFDMEYDYLLNAGLASDFWVIYETLGFM